ncbi:ArsR/SmtB family transcription factor [Pseudonocardia bannensis]|uniref:Helix-turn-helix transcriptional regulator n=1 Tax=Pseudonocardia bannensis TaxID=630973 RepID=A0A848DLH0_9PSEU|nr:metalloregulator ArsR/SmtB family transcription factor [Pseudonocardia bannensis]NMH93558.1 helix-turn-helix transcriptional regulator [Pseudonocardia bannensis]
MIERSAVPGPEHLDRVFRALAHPARRDMLARLSTAPHSVGDLAAPYAMSLAAASKHVQTLEGAGLVQRTVEGRTHMCRLDPAPLAAVHEWIGPYERFWSDPSGSLAAMFRPSGNELTPDTGQVPWPTP